MKFIALPLLALTVFASVAKAADLKIGVVDLNKAFAEYHATKKAQATLQENAELAKQQIAERFARLKSLNDEREKSIRAMQDPVLNNEAREKARSAAMTKEQEFRSLERDVREFQTKREQQLQAEGMQERKGLYDVILQRVNEKAKTDSFDLVFDRSAFSAQGLPFLLHLKDGATTDFTAELIVELNKDAGAAPAAPAPAPAPTTTPATGTKGKK